LQVIASTFTNLHIHREDPSVRDSVADLGIPAFEPMCEAIERLTGCRLDYEPGGASGTDSLWSTQIVSADSEPWGSLVLRTPDPISDEKRQAVTQLVDSIGRLTSELLSANSALAERESELAVGIPVVVEKHDAKRLADRLRAVLRGICEGIRCQAAAVYALDDATTVLKLRSHWGLPATRLTESARPLRGALADLEALTGHAVVIEDSSLLPHWKVPEPFESAVCVPIAGPSTVLGTLWVFCDHVRDFTPEETNLIEIVAGRVATELERTALLYETRHIRNYERFQDEMLQWQQDRSLLVPPSIDGWEVAGAVAHPFSLVRDFFHWRLLDDNRVAVAAGGAWGNDGATLLATTGLQASLQSVLFHGGDPEDVLVDLNEYAWTQSTGDRTASIFYAAIDSSSGRVSYSSAGTPEAYILRSHGWQPICSKRTMLGIDPDIKFEPAEVTLGDGDALLVVSDRELIDPGTNTTAKMAETLLRYVDGSANDLVRIAADLVGLPAEPARSPAFLIVKRNTRVR
jgi:hypothetical protein